MSPCVSAEVLSDENGCDENGMYVNEVHLPDELYLACTPLTAMADEVIALSDSQCSMTWSGSTIRIER